jgi:hypothetical protein
VEKRNAYRIRDHWEHQDVCGRTTLKWILEKYDGMEWSGELLDWKISAPGLDNRE